MKVTMKTTGFKELGQSLKNLEKAVATKVAASMLAAGARVIKAAAKRNAPDSEQPHTIEGVRVYPGNLKKNIISKKRGKKATKLTAEYVVAVRGKARGLYASRYGSMVEHGTVNMRAQPFMRPAFDQNVTRALNAIKEKGQKRIAEEAAKAKK